MFTAVDAIATILTDAGIVDYRPHPATGGDVYLENWVNAGEPDTSVLVSSNSARVTYGTRGFETVVKLTFRGRVNTQADVYSRAMSAYNALRTLTVPVGVDGFQIHGLWAAPPLVQRQDIAGRPEAIMLVRVRHADVVI